MFYLLNSNDECVARSKSYRSMFRKLVAYGADYRIVEGN